MASSAHVTTEAVVYEDTPSAELSAPLPTDGAWWPGAHSAPSTTHTAIAGQLEGLTLSVEATNGDKGMAVDRSDIQPLSAVGAAHSTPQMAVFPTVPESHYVPDTQMESSYYIPSNAASQAANENFESENFQPYPSWNSADGPSESQFPAQLGWGW